MYRIATSAARGIAVHSTLRLNKNQGVESNTPGPDIQNRFHLRLALDFVDRDMEGLTKGPSIRISKPSCLGTAVAFLGERV